MTAEQALDRLRRMVAYDVAPTLDEAAMDDMVTMRQLADVDGYAPSEDDWTPTYDLNRGAAEGWRWKAAATAARFDFEADGGSFKRDQILQHCLEMAKRYAAKIAGSVTLPGVTSLSSYSEDEGELDEYESDLAAAGTGPYEE